MICKGFQIWKVAANILNNQLRAADKGGGPPFLRLCMGLTNLVAKVTLLRTAIKGLGHE
jgi:hypothetical protein